MRKLYQLLPIVRKRLISVEHPEEVYGDYDVFTCLAARFASKHGEITQEEYKTLKLAISVELTNQRGFNTIYATLNCPTPTEYDIEFFPLRDAWLDELQQKLEREDR